MNIVIKTAQNVITSSTKETVGATYLAEWRKLSNHDKKKIEKWFIDNKIASKVKDAPKYYELIVTPEQQAMDMKKK